MKSVVRISFGMLLVNLTLCFGIEANDRLQAEFDYLDGVQTISIQNLPLYADGVQLEGGYLYKHLKPWQKYANVSVVWDMPFNNLSATEAFAHRGEKFRESRLEQYNEHQVINLIANLILYYLKSSSQDQKIVFCFYIGKRSSLNLFEIVEKILKKYDPSLAFKRDDSSGTRIGWISDKAGHVMEVITHYRWLNGTSFEGAGTIVGFSWNGGFNKEYTSSDFLIPTQFIDIAKGKKFNVLFLKDKYTIKNDFYDNLSKFVAFQDKRLVDIVNTEFTSENEKKSSHRARVFVEKDFYKGVTLLGTWDIFEPSRWPADVVIPE